MRWIGGMLKNMEIAKKIAIFENANRHIAELAAFLHNIDDRKNC